MQGEIDTRLFTKKGQQQIAQDFLKTTMITDTIKEIATNETVEVTDFFNEVEKLNTTYETIKSKIATDSDLAAILNSPAYTDEQKNTILNEVTNQVMVELGYTPITTKLIATTKTGRDGNQVKGYYSLQTDTSYVNDLYNSNNYELLSTSATEAQRAMDAQNGSTFNQSDSYRDDRATYSQNFGNNVADYTNFVLYYTDQGTLSTLTNPLTNTNQATSSPSVFNTQTTNNNLEFAGLDKNQGDNYSLEVANNLAEQFPGMTVYYDVNSQDPTGKYSIGPIDQVAKYVTIAMPSLTDDEKQKITNDRLKKVGKNTLELANGLALLYGGAELMAGKTLLKSTIKSEEKQFINMIEKNRNTVNETQLSKIAKEPKTLTKLLKDLKKPTPTIETVGVPRPIDGALNKVTQLKQIARENKISSSGTTGDKVNKVRENTTKSVMDILGGE